MNAGLRKVGPGALVTAAFIGPGTVTACTLAGANHGYALLWALAFATLATIALQEMAARLGLVTQQGLGANLAALLAGSPWRWPLIVLVGAALYLGNAAYEAGNLAGAAIGIAAIAGEGDALFAGAVLTLAGLSAALLVLGSYVVIERVLMALVIAMALAFIASFAIARPDPAALFTGLVTPRIPDGALLTAIALIGTTIVPYNLFLHASAASAKWDGASDLTAMRADTGLSIGLGGVIAILIASSAAASLFASGIAVESAADMARQFEPLFGPYARLLMGAGLFAAGLTSAITAPLATAFAMTEIVRIEGGTKSIAFRAIALSVIAVGAGLSLAGIKPIEVILTAQFANGLLLPIIAAFLLAAMNRRALLGEYANGWFANLAGGATVLVAAGLGIRLIWRVFA
ncbi:MAG: Nramp family divalent metal transporter [Pseudomonadota bacterium]